VPEADFLVANNSIIYMFWHNVKKLSIKVPEADFLVANNSMIYMFWHTEKKGFYQNGRGGFFIGKSLYYIYVLAHCKNSFLSKCQRQFF